MNEIRDILGTALPESPPPTTITTQSVIAAGQRLRRRHRATLTSVGAGLAALVVLVGAAVLYSSGIPTTPVGAPGTPSSTATAPPASPTAEPTPPPTGRATPPPQSPSPGGDGGPSSLTNIAPEVTSALLTATAQVAPQVHVAGVRDAWAGLDLGPYETVKSQGGIKAWAVLSDAKGPGTLFINLNPGVASGEPPTCQGQPAGCTTRVGPAGEAIVITQGKEPGTVRYINVSISKTDGTQVYAMLQNYSQNDQPTNQGGQPYAQRSTQVLSVDQLVTILLAPGVTIPPGLKLEP